MDTHVLSKDPTKVFTEAAGALPSGKLLSSLAGCSIYWLEWFLSGLELGRADTVRLALDVLEERGEIDADDKAAVLSVLTFHTPPDKPSA